MPGPEPGIHVFVSVMQEDVDGRDKPGHDEWRDISIKPTEPRRAVRPGPADAVGRRGRGRAAAARAGAAAARDCRIRHRRNCRTDWAAAPAASWARPVSAARAPRWERCPAPPVLHLAPRPPAFPAWHLRPVRRPWPARG